jgi:hypothetical protein
MKVTRDIRWNTFLLPLPGMREVKELKTETKLDGFSTAAFFSTTGGGTTTSTAWVDKKQRRGIRKGASRSGTRSPVLLTAIKTS